MDQIKSKGHAISGPKQSELSPFNSLNCRERDHKRKSDCKYTSPENCTSKLAKRPKADG